MFWFLNVWIDYLIIRSISFVLAVTLHEYAHWYVSYRLWDPTAKMQWRLTLNPLKHLDPIWTLMLFVIGIGRAKPVPINKWYYKDPHKWELLVALAGPAINILLSIIAVFLTVFIFFLTDQGASSLWATTNILFSFLQLFAIINILLALFNLIPIPPLDWFNIVKNFWPDFSNKVSVLQARYWFYSIILLWVLLRLGFFDWIMVLSTKLVNIFYIVFANIFL